MLTCSSASAWSSCTSLMPSSDFFNSSSANCRSVSDLDKSLITSMLWRLRALNSATAFAAASVDSSWSRIAWLVNPRKSVTFSKFSIKASMAMISAVKINGVAAFLRKLKLRAVRFTLRCVIRNDRISDCVLRGSTPVNNSANSPYAFSPELPPPSSSLRSFLVSFVAFFTPSSTPDVSNSATIGSVALRLAIADIQF